MLALRGLGCLLAPAQGACVSLGLCGVALAFLMFPRGEGTQLLSIFPQICALPVLCPSGCSRGKLWQEVVVPSPP